MIIDKNQTDGAENFDDNGGSFQNLWNQPHIDLESNTISSFIKHLALEECDVTEELALTSSLRTRKEELDVFGCLSLGRICVKNIDTLPLSAGQACEQRL